MTLKAKDSCASLIKYFGAQAHVFDKTFVEVLGISRSRFMPLVVV